MNSAKQKLHDAVEMITANTKQGDVVSVSQIAESVELTEQEEQEIRDEIVKRAVSQLAAKGIRSDIAPEELARLVSEQIAINELADDLDAHIEGDLFIRVR